MNQNIFNFTRFKNLFIRDLFSDAKPVVTTIVGSFIALTLVLFLVLLFNQNDTDIAVSGFGNFVFPAAFIISALFITGNAFRDFRNKERKMGYLMLPSTTLEKFLSQYLIVTLVFTILMILFYYLFGIFSMTVIAIFTDFSMDLSFPYDSNKIIPFLRVFIPVQFLLLAGAVTFKKKPLFYTGLSGFLFSNINSLIAVGTVFLLFSSSDPYNVHLNDSFFLVNNPTNLKELEASDFNLWSFKALYYFYQYLIPAFSIIYIWFKIKEKEA